MPAEARTPQQRRSRDKQRRILATTARLLETVPYEELGTTAIAAEAGVSVGILYRLFPDKAAIVATLIREWNEHDVRIVDAVAAERPAAEDSEGLLLRLVAAHADRFRREPGYRNVWFDGPRLSVLGVDGSQVNRRIAERVHALLVDRHALPDTPETRRRAGIAVELAGSILSLAFKDDPAGDPAVLADGAMMLDRYLFAPLRAT